MPHDPDVGIRGWGSTLPEAIAQGALALTAVMSTAPALPKALAEVAWEAPDSGLLLGRG
ncbi:MAG: archease [Alphaproteobacteria bacterium]|nr:archease [Alphaproteobacteria bacterium]